MKIACDPIGFTIGNALETLEALEVLHGRGPEDLQELTFALGAEMLRAADIEKTEAQRRRRLHDAVRSGRALDRMRAIVAAQEGDPRVVDEPDRLKLARHRATVAAQSDGYVSAIDPLELGYASMGLGAGRTRAEDAVDPGAGIRLHVRIGDSVRLGDELATLHASKRSLLDASTDRTAAAFRIGTRRHRPASRIIETIRR